MHSEGIPIIIDTNVPVLAGSQTEDIPEDQISCAIACNEFIHRLISSNENQRVVLDYERRILTEYRNNCISKNEDGMSILFLNWIYEYLASRVAVERDLVSLVSIGEDTFSPYPENQKLKDFDPADRKFIALAFVHPEHPAIIEGTDSEWWGIRDELRHAGIVVRFLDEKYVKAKYAKKYISSTGRGM
jgi:hypothetical protein